MKAVQRCESSRNALPGGSDHMGHVQVLEACDAAADESPRQVIVSRIVLRLQGIGAGIPLVCSSNFVRATA